MKIYFVRHGESVNNINDILNSNPDINYPLTELGIKQAHGASEKLKAKKFEAVFHSGFPRTKQTAMAINKFHGAPMFEDRQFGDIQTGFDGQKTCVWKEFVRHNPIYGGTKQGESFAVQYKRVTSALKRIKNKGYKEIVIVAHQDTGRIIKTYSDRKPLGKYRWLVIKNCEVLEFKL